MRIYRVDRYLVETENYDNQNQYLLILNKTQEDIVEVLNKLQIQPLFIQDVLQEDIIKYENIDELKILTLSLNSIDIQNNIINSYQFSLIIKNNLLITIVDNNTEEFMNKIMKLYSIKKFTGNVFLVYLIIDNILSDNLFILDYLESKYKNYERKLSNIAVSELDQKYIFKIFDIKDMLSVIRKQNQFYRDVFINIKRDLFDEDTRIYYEDLLDKWGMLNKDAELLDDKIQNFVTQTLLIMNFSAAEATKLLSAISAIFLPMSVLASIYGMNFENIPELKHPLGYYFVLIMIITSGILSYYIMKRKRYI